MTTASSASYGLSQRTFQQAIVHRLETEYKLVGSHRILDMIATDILALMDEYYPHGERATMGTIIWTTSANTGRKPTRDERMGYGPPITVLLPWVTADELAAPPPTDRRSAHERTIARAVRLVKAAQAAGGLLTLSELAVLFNVTTTAVSIWLDEHYQRTGEVVPLKGYVLDLGRQPSHKDIIVHLFEQKIDAVEIARRTGHHQMSVDRYIHDYERVKLLVSKGMSLDEISHTIGKGVSTIRQYWTLVKHYHPELCLTSDSKNASNPAKL